MAFLAITSGDPCGIGPEVILKTLAKRSTPRDVRIGVIGDRRVFTEASRRLRLRLPAWVVFLDCAHRTRFRPGCSSAAAGRASLAYLDRAIALWKAGQLDALVTVPVTKWAIARTQPLFVGQTEYLARSCGVRDVVMLFVSDALRVALLTRHVPLRRVAQAIDRRLLRTSIRLTDQALRMQFGIRRPRLAVCGINPHAGEASSRSEERRLIVPVLRALRREGLRCEGPFAADGFFAQPHAYDVVVCAYHDQGLIPFKMVARDLGCQVSVGLPMVRTSPDHGSALDIAGRGVADPGSMRYALELAIRLMKQPGRLHFFARGKPRRKRKTSR